MKLGEEEMFVCYWEMKIRRRNAEKWSQKSSHKHNDANRVPFQNSFLCLLFQPRQTQKHFIINDCKALMIVSGKRLLTVTFGSPSNFTPGGIGWERERRMILNFSTHTRQSFFLIPFCLFNKAQLKNVKDKTRDPSLETHMKDEKNHRILCPLRTNQKNGWS